jgi:hypothetical protein
MVPSWLGTLLVAAAAALGNAVVPGSLLAGLDDPSAWGARAFYAVVLAMLALRALRGPASPAERATLCALLAGMPGVYVAGAIATGAGGATLAVEVVGLVFIAAVAAAGWFGSARVLGVGLVMHGMLWDAWHHETTPVVAAWYPAGCAYVDVALGLYVLGRSWDGEGADYSRRHARRYDRFTLALCREFPAMAQAVAAAVAGKDTALELAAGTGLVTMKAAPGVRCDVATDGSDEMLEVLQERLRGVAGLETRVADSLQTGGARPALRRRRDGGRARGVGAARGVRLPGRHALLGR